MSDGPKILDLDKLIPEQRIVRLAGKEFDVSKVPTRVVLEIEKNKKKLQSGGDETFEMLLDLTAKICRPSCPDVTVEWLVDNTDFNQLQALLEFVMKPIREKADKAAAKAGKNTDRPDQ